MTWFSDAQRSHRSTQFQDLLRMLFGEVMRFGPIDGDVVQFPWLVIEGHKLPPSGSNRPVALVLKEQIPIATVSSDPIDLTDHVGMPGSCSFPHRTEHRRRSMAVGIKSIMCIGTSTIRAGESPQALCRPMHDRRRRDMPPS